MQLYFIWFIIKNHNFHLSSALKTSGIMIRSVIFPHRMFYFMISAIVFFFFFDVASWTYCYFIWNSKVVSNSGAYLGIVHVLSCAAQYKRHEPAHSLLSLISTHFFHIITLFHPFHTIFLFFFSHLCSFSFRARAHASVWVFLFTCIHSHSHAHKHIYSYNISHLIYIIYI